MDEFRRREILKLLILGVVGLSTMMMYNVNLQVCQSIIVSCDAIIRQERKRKRKEEEFEEMPLMGNRFRYREGGIIPLPYTDRFGNMCSDPGRNYCKKS